MPLDFLARLAQTSPIYLKLPLAVRLSFYFHASLSRWAPGKAGAAIESTQGSGIATRCRLPQVRSFLGDHGQSRHGAMLLGFGYYGVEVIQDFGDGHGVDLTTGVVSLFD